MQVYRAGEVVKGIVQGLLTAAHLQICYAFHTRHFCNLLKAAAAATPAAAPARKMDSSRGSGIGQCKSESACKTLQGRFSLRSFVRHTRKKDRVQI